MLLFKSWISLDSSSSFPIQSLPMFAVLCPQWCFFVTGKRKDLERMDLPILTRTRNPNILLKKAGGGGFPGGPVAKNLLANARGTGSVLGLRSLTPLLTQACVPHF